MKLEASTKKGGGRGGVAKFLYLDGRICLEGLLVAMRDGDSKSGVQNGRTKVDELPHRQLHDAAEPVELVVTML